MNAKVQKLLLDYLYHTHQEFSFLLTDNDESDYKSLFRSGIDLAHTAERVFEELAKNLQDDNKQLQPKNKTSVKDDISVKLPNEVWQQIFKYFLKNDCTSNADYRNLSLTSKHFASIALPLLWNKIKVRHDNITKLYSLVTGFKSNSKYRAKNKHWFSPATSSLTFYSTLDGDCYRSETSEIATKNIMKCIFPYVPNLIDINHVIPYLGARITYNFDDLYELFSNCPNLKTLDLNSVLMPSKDSMCTDNILDAVVDGFSTLRELHLATVTGDQEMFFKRANFGLLQIWELDDISTLSAEYISRSLENLKSLKMNSKDDGETTSFNEEGAGILIQNAKNLESINIEIGLSDKLLKLISENNANLTCFSGDIDSEKVSWDGLYKFFKQSGQNLQRIQLNFDDAFALDKYQFLNLSVVMPNLIKFEILNLNIFKMFETKISDNDGARYDMNEAILIFQKFLKNLKHLKYFCLQQISQWERKEKLEFYNNIKFIFSERKIICYDPTKRSN
ncbi:hypothetical protein HDU92_001566 [Lobulomyces angularis]|nr:hypothetical protein HDU92_001566 [Lobulomyces angularis]